MELVLVAGASYKNWRSLYVVSDTASELTTPPQRSCFATCRGRD